MDIRIVEPGTRVQVRDTDTYLTVKDQGCVWDNSDVVYFTETGWKDYVERQNDVSASIDEMRRK